MTRVTGVAASQEQDFGTANLHMEVSDIISVLVYVGVAKGNGVLSKTGEINTDQQRRLLAAHTEAEEVTSCPVCGNIKDTHMSSSS